MQVFQALMYPYSPALLQRIARAHSRRAEAHVAAVSLPPPPATVMHATKRLSVGYVSGGFDSHVIGYLVNRALELHDRRRFRVVVYPLLVKGDKSADFPVVEHVRWAAVSLSWLGEPVCVYVKSLHTCPYMCSVKS